MIYPQTLSCKAKLPPHTVYLPLQTEARLSILLREFQKEVASIAAQSEDFKTGFGKLHTAPCRTKHCVYIVLLMLL